MVADDLKLEYVSEFWTGNGVGVVYHPTPSDAAARAAWQAMALGEVYPIVIVEGGIYDEPTTFVITETAHDQYFDGFAFRFDVESAGMEIGAGFEYTITTQLVDAQGNVRFVFTDIEDTVTAGVSTDGAVNRPSDCLTGEDVRNLLEHRKDFADEFDPYGSYTNGWTWNGEGVENLFDGDWQTKMAGGFTDASIFWSYNSPVCIGAYVLVTGNDSAEFWGRNPVEWTLYGSHDGEDWAVVDEVSWAGFAASNCEPYGRIVENGQEYVYYRLSVRSRDQFQLGEIILLGEEESAEPPAEKLQGDANGDGVVNMRDVATIAQYLAGLEVELDAEAADVTGEGYINSKDITRLREYLSGIDVELN